MIVMIKKLWRISGEYKQAIQRMIVCNVLKAIFTGISLAGVSFLMYRIIFPASARSFDVAILTGVMIFSVVGKVISSYYASHYKNVAAFGIGSKSRLHIGDKLKQLHMGYFNDHSLGTIAGGLTTVISNLENTGFYIIEHTISGTLESMMMIFCICIFDWPTGLITLLGLLVSTSINRVSKRKIDTLTLGLQDCRLRLDSAMLEFVQGMGVIKAFGKTSQAFSKIQGSISENQKGSIAIEKALAPVQSSYSISLKIFSCLIMLFSIYRFYNDSISLPTVMILILLSFSCFASIEMVGMMHNVQGIALKSLETIEQMQNLEPMAEGTMQTITKGNINLEKVSFSYDEGVRVIHDVTTFIQPGKTTAIVGPSGCGKSTLCSLIARFWDVDSGRIQIDGIDVREYAYDSLLEQISIIFQDVYLFEDTVKNNICFGNPNATDKEMIEVAKKACCHDFIMELPNGYDTVLQEGGVSLSGGERQRISIARAMLKNAKIVIMDEATASVDPENEQKLTQALAELVKGKTAIMIAHRLHTIQTADRILVMDRGCIVQEGSHEQLLTTSKLYRKFIRIRNDALEWELGN